MLTKFLQNHLYRQQESSKRQTLQSILLLMSLSQTCRPWSKHLVSWGQGDALVSQSQSPKSWKYGAMQLEKKAENKFHPSDSITTVKASTETNLKYHIHRSRLDTYLYRLCSCGNKWTHDQLEAVLQQTPEELQNYKKTQCSMHVSKRCLQRSGGSKALWADLHRDSLA